MSIKKEQINKNRQLLTVQESAEYEGVAVKTVKRWIRSGKISSIKKKGKNKYRSSQNYIHYAQLGEEAREKFIQDRGLASKKKSGALKAEDQQYLGLTAKQRDRFDQNNQVVKLFLDAIQNLPPKRKTAFTKEFAKIHGMSEAKLRRLVREYLKDGIEGLIPRWSPGVQNRKFENDREAVEFVNRDYMRELGPSILESHQRYCQEFKGKRDDLFSLTTYANVIKTKWTPSERLLAREPDQWQKHHGLYINRDWDKCALNEVWFSDAKQIDIACLYNGKVIFPWLTAFLDAKSRKFVGWVLTPSPDRWAISGALDYAIATHGVPKVIYIDRGKPYKSYMISGKKIKSRVIDSFENIEREPFIGQFREAGSEVYFAYPRWPREKIIEANFGLFTDRDRDAPGNRSWDTKHRPKKLEREIRAGKLLTFDQLYTRVNKTLGERNARPHSTTKKSPNSYYENNVPVVPSESFRAFLKMDRHWIKIRNSGVKIGRDFYRGVELWRHSGEVAECRRDPADIRKCAVILNGKLLEIARLESKGHYRSEITLKNREIVHKINQDIRRERKKLVHREAEILANPDPLKVAMDMGQEPKLKPREIRPACKVTSLHKNEKLSRQVMKELEKSEPDLADIENEAVTANQESIFSKYAAISKRKNEAPKPRLRLIPREKLTMFEKDEED